MVRLVEAIEGERELLLDAVHRRERIEYAKEETTRKVAIIQERIQAQKTARAERIAGLRKGAA